MRKSLLSTAVAMLVTIFMTTTAAQSQFNASRFETPNPPTLTCSPAPCILPNVQVSEGGMPVTAAVISVNPNNSKQFIVATEDGNCPPYQIGISASGDGGGKWNSACVYPVLGDAASPLAGYDLNGRAFVGGLYSNAGNGPWGVSVSNSTNNGKSWTSPVSATYNEPDYFTWLPWMTVDANSGSPNKNAIYVSSPQIQTVGNSQNSQLWIAHSNDVGQNWSVNVVDPLQNGPLTDAYSHIAVGEDGTVYVAWLRCVIGVTTNLCAGNKGQILFSASTDGGNTWSAPIRIASVSLVGNTLSCFFGCLPGTYGWMSNLPALAVNGSGASAQVYVTFYNSTGSQMQVEVAASSNGGASWQQPVRVTTSKFGDEFFPWVSLDGSGRLVATWMDRRNDPANLLYQPFIAYSTDQGKTFHGDLPLSLNNVESYARLFVFRWFWSLPKSGFSGEHDLRRLDGYEDRSIPDRSGRSKLLAPTLPQALSHVARAFSPRLSWRGSGARKIPRFASG